MASLILSTSAATDDAAADLERRIREAILAMPEFDAIRRHRDTFGDDLTGYSLFSRFDVKVRDGFVRLNLTAPHSIEARDLDVFTTTVKALAADRLAAHGLDGTASRVSTRENADGTTEVAATIEARINGTEATFPTDLQSAKHPAPLSHRLAVTLADAAGLLGIVPSAEAYAVAVAPWLHTETTTTPPPIFTIYHVFDADDQLLYVGKTARWVLSRADEHVRMKPWAHRIASFRVTHYETAADMNEAEKRDIATLNPPLNQDRPVPNWNRVAPRVVPMPASPVAFGEYAGVAN
jgi:hypothetical protein